MFVPSSNQIFVSKTEGGGGGWNLDGGVFGGALDAGVGAESWIEEEFFDDPQVGVVDGRVIVELWSNLTNEGKS